MIVTLSKQQVAEATQIGAARNLYVVTHAIEQYWGREMTPIAKAFHAIYGALGECAVAHVLNIPWPDRSIEEDFRGAGDVGGVVEVRARPVPGSGVDLGVRPKDLEKFDAGVAADKPYALVHVRTIFGEMEIAGWEYGSEVRKLGEWNQTSGCSYLRATDLRSPEILLKQFGKRAVA